MNKGLTRTLIAAAATGAASVLALAAATAGAQEEGGKIGEGVVVYMQMGGLSGQPPVLPRETGAQAAAEALGVELHPQYSEWAPERMLQQFDEAVAASPDCIVIMGHPGSDAFADRVADAVAQGIVVTSGNSPLNELMPQHQAQGFGYAGVDLYEGGAITARAMLNAGLQAGDKALVYELFSQGDRGLSGRGLADTLEEAGVIVDRVEMPAEVNADPTQAIDDLVAYLQENPDTKAIATQHGGVTPQLAAVAQQAGKAPGDLIIGGIDTDPRTLEGVESGYMTATLDQQLYLQGFLPVLQCVLSAKYEMGGFTVNTAAGTVSPDNVGTLMPLIEQGIR